MSVAQQNNLFDSGPQRLFDDSEGSVVYRPGLIDATTADRWFDILRAGVAWRAMRRRMYDRVVDVPRLVAAFRLEDPALPMPLAEVAARLHDELGVSFNTVGLNYYRDGRDSVAPHNDKMHTLLPGHPIALVSLGAARRMTVRAKQSPRQVRHIDLEPGSLLTMSYISQLRLDHGIPKTRDPVGVRISLAFRVRPSQRSRD